MRPDDVQDEREMGHVFSNVHVILYYIRAYLMLISLFVIFNCHYETLYPQKSQSCPFISSTSIGVDTVDLGRRLNLHVLIYFNNNS